MNLQSNQKGFTIVELLIVIVVIAILAAISIVAYTNIQNRARTSTAVSSAKTVRDVAEAYRGANSEYPTTHAQFVSGGTDSIARMPDDIEFGADPAAGNNGKTVTVRACREAAAPSPVVAIEVTYRDFQNNNNVTTSTGQMPASDTHCSAITS